MAELRSFTARPLSKQPNPKSDHRDAFRIYLSSSSMASLRLRAGDPCSLTLSEGSPKTAIAWTAVENIQNTVFQTSRTLQDLYGIKIGEKIAITKLDNGLDELASVSLVDSSDAERIEKYGPIPVEERHFWAWVLESNLTKCEVLANGLTFELDLKGQRRSFSVVGLQPQNGGSSKNTIFRFVPKTTKISIGAEIDEPEDTTSEISVQPGGLGGLSRQIQDINESLTDFNMDQRKLVMPAFYENNRGILIFGPKGTGKTTLLQQIEKAGWRQVFKIGTSSLGRSVSEGESKLRGIFQEAVRAKPSVIIIDQLEFVAPKRTSFESQSMASVLCENLDSIRSASVLVVAATRHPNSVDDSLRTPHRLGTEIELQVPTAQDRAEILRAIRGPASSGLSDAFIDLLAEKTHGYVGADLFALLQLICRKARQRQSLEQGLSLRALEISPSPQEEEEPGVQLDIQMTDVLSSLQEIRPTAMREVFLETPKVRWTDIGGQKEIKERLQNAVERPLKHAQRMQRLNVKSKKGVLLYGPPGCSKTLTVKALATEAGLNFLAVKGAEILSMYVGESERSLREIFRKARAARPSIIFFDEIDAIAGRRSSSSQGGVNVLTTLLNEMDGIEELRGVLVVAATNKPDVLDPALMRPGRLDKLIWAKKSVLNPDVNLDELAERMEGYSGAEVVSICETAGDAALDEEDRTQQEQDVKLEHFELALSQVKRQITDEVIQEYEDWAEAQS
ncbi:ATPase [Penicillium hetheringtonii]|uniref:ATPase n=1 Tax=Penicillium hetheringtonii TaxID=911720 RepID=A0AAD6DH73_9EURO|nr:ATPase [Penicillium hetheringtonii]